MQNWKFVFLFPPLRQAAKRCVQAVVENTQMKSWLLKISMLSSISGVKLSQKAEIYKSKNWTETEFRRIQFRELKVELKLNWNLTETEKKQNRIWLNWISWTKIEQKTELNSAEFSHVNKKAELKR